MCLRTITKNINPPDPTERTAWKMFYKGRGGLMFPWYTPSYFLTNSAGTDAWLIAEGHDLETWNGDKYRSGFHSFKTRAGLRQFIKDEGIQHQRKILMRVKIRGVHTIGKQSYHDVYVSEELLIPGSGK